MLTARAAAKINLSLHVVRRRADGYHDIESIVAFASSGDTLTLIPGPELSVLVRGPMARGLGPPADNLVLKAAQEFARRCERARLGAFRLEKRLPVAAGLGGGSSDAGSALRLLAQLNELDVEHPAVMQAAAATGADVPVCVAGRARRMSGIGERLGPALRLPALSAVLVNPRVPVATAAVFEALGLVAGRRHAEAIHPDLGADLTPDALIAALSATRNDLEAPAIALAPTIAEALAAVRATPRCRLARMSGSGATVFGLYDDRMSAGRAARQLHAARPQWWIKPTRLR